MYDPSHLHRLAQEYECIIMDTSAMLGEQEPGEPFSENLHREIVLQDNIKRFFNHTTPFKVTDGVIRELQVGIPGLRRLISRFRREEDTLQDAIRSRQGLITHLYQVHAILAFKDTQPELYAWYGSQYGEVTQQHELSATDFDILVYGLITAQQMSTMIYSFDRGLYHAWRNVRNAERLSGTQLGFHGVNDAFDARRNQDRRKNLESRLESRIPGVVQG